MKTENYDRELQENGGRRDGNVLVFVHEKRGDESGLELRQRFAQPDETGTYHPQWTVRMASDMPYYEEIIALATIVGKDPDFHRDHPRYPTNDFEISEVWEKEIKAWRGRKKC